MAHYIPKIPVIVHGFDAETKALRPDAYILSMGMATFDIATLTLLGCSYVAVDPNDPEANEIFHTDPGTLEWWEGKGNPDYAPSPEARKAAFSGTTKMPDALRIMVNYVEQFKKFDSVIVSRGPEFDIPIVCNALVRCNQYQGLFRRFSANDSDRTVERLMLAMGLEMDQDTEQHNWLRSGGEWVEHHPGFDSARSAYRTARAYHLAHIAKNHGFEQMLVAHKALRAGNYNPPLGFKGEFNGAS